MIYTCYDMISDCRADHEAGWSYLLCNFVPVIRKILDHYAPADPGLLSRVLLSLHDPASTLFRSLDPAPERWFVAELRQLVLAQVETAPAGVEVDLPTVAGALQPLTVAEKQAAWFETMRYDATATGAMLRMAPETVEKIRDRAAELLRANVDAWSATLLAENGAALGRAAASSAVESCLPAKVFLDVLDGRMTWLGRETMEQHISGCWHCIDHFCRMMEVVELLRGVRPLSDDEAAPYRKLLGIHPAKRPLWKRWTGGA